MPKLWFDVVLHVVIRTLPTSHSDYEIIREALELLEKVTAWINEVSVLIDLFLVMFWICFVDFSRKRKNVESSTRKESESWRLRSKIQSLIS
jgi:hypothetical protein